MPGPRYSLEDRVVEGEHWALWRGADVVLRRPVGILVVGAEHPHREAVATAAIRTGGFHHPGAVHVYDCADAADGSLQVVREWVDARTLVDRLAEGPLEPAEACRVGAAVARILAAAHEVGLAHGRLNPRDVFISDDGRVRLIGIAVSAALDSGAVEADPARRTADARDAAGVAYAAVTGRWPGNVPRAGLPNAPTRGEHPARARQVRAGVPAALDTALAHLLESPTDATHAAETLEDLEDRLQPGRGGPLGGPPADGDDDSSRPPTTAHRVLVRALAIVISIAVLTAIAATALTLLHDDHIASVTRPTPSTTPSTASSSPITSSQSATPSPTTTPVGPITVASAKDFDPEGDGSENPGQVGAAIDGDLSTAWHTVHYLQANLAPKHGVGLVLDLGRAQSVGAVRIDLVGTGTDVQVRTSTSPGTVPGDYTLLGQATKAGKLVTVQGKAAVSARYILIWLTRLPPVPGGFQGGVAEVTVLRA